MRAWCVVRVGNSRAIKGCNVGSDDENRAPPSSTCSPRHREFKSHIRTSASSPFICVNATERPTAPHLAFFPRALDTHRRNLIWSLIMEAIIPSSSLPRRPELRETVCAWKSVRWSVFASLQLILLSVKGTQILQRLLHLCSAQWKPAHECQGCWEMLIIHLLHP